MNPEFSGANKKRGRPIALTPQMLATLLGAIRRCLFVVSACHLAGVPRSTLYGWLKRAKKEPESIYGDLAAGLRKALAEAEADALHLINEAAKETWTAAAWILERRWPKRWASNAKAFRDLENEVRDQLEKLDGLMRAKVGPDWKQEADRIAAQKGEADK
jgi:hypothetical protein